MGYRPEGSLRLDGRPLDDPVLLDEVGDVLLGGCLSNDALLREEGGQWTIHGDPTEAAFLVAEAKVGGLAEAREARFERVGEVPFSSERKLADHAAGGRRARRHRGRHEGGADVLLGRCAFERAAGEIRPLTEERRAAILAVDRLGGQAMRTLGVAYRPPRGSRAAGRRGRRARARPPGRRRDHRPAATRGGARDR